MSIEALDADRDGYPGGPAELVLVGPPGTGKTRSVLQAWLVPAVTAGPCREVLGCSFTRAAAREMRERLARETGLSFRDLQATCKTIHSESLRLSRELGGLSAVYDERRAAQEQPAQEEPPPRPQAKQLELGVQEEEDGEPTGWEALAAPCKELRSEAIRLWTLARHRFPQDLLDGVPPERLLSRVAAGSTFMLGELAAEVRAIEADKQALGQIDFTDMLLQALRLPAPFRRLIVVDEAQDLSPLQILVIRHWVGHAERLVWVGDPDQGIFAFAGADGTFLTRLIRGGVASRSLQRSWRVPRCAHALARELIRLNRDRVDAPYLPAERDGEVVRLKTAAAALRLALAVQDGSSAFVLSHTGRGLAPYAQWFCEQGVPFSQERGGSSPLRQRKLVQTVVAILCLIRRQQVPAESARALIDVLPGRPRGTWFSRTKKAAQVAIQEAVNSGTSMSADELRNAGVRLDRLLPEPSIEAALKRIKLYDQAIPLLRIVECHSGDIGALTSPPRITLTTIHGSKGREADHVVLDLACPTAAKRELLASREGEEGKRRVLYVGITRTRQTLILVAAPVEEDDLGYLLGLADTGREMCA